MTTPADVIRVARSRVGLAEQPLGSNRVPGITDWYGMSGAWCGMFVSRTFADAGLPLGPGPRGFAWCSAGADWFRAQGRTRPSRDARPGDVAFFEWGTTAGGFDHVGIVIANDGRGLDTIEGNTSDRVQYHRRRYSEVPEVGRPAYTTDAPDYPPPFPSPLPPPAEELTLYAYQIATHEVTGQLWLLWGPRGQAPIYRKYLRTADDVRLAQSIYGATDMGPQGALIDFLPYLPEDADVAR